jgi:hypothetical protein
MAEFPFETLTLKSDPAGIAKLCANTQSSPDQAAKCPLRLVTFLSCLSFVNFALNGGCDPTSGIRCCYRVAFVASQIASILCARISQATTLADHCRKSFRIWVNFWIPRIDP